MKKMTKILMVIMMLFAVTAVMPTDNAEAKSKSSVCNKSHMTKEFSNQQRKNIEGAFGGIFKASTWSIFAERVTDNDIISNIKGTFGFVSKVQKSTYSCY